jgi:uncharacterized protein
MQEPNGQNDVPKLVLNRPVQPSERLEVVDGLRGLALFGVLAINLETAFRTSIFEQFIANPPYGGLERLVAAFLTIFIDLKAFALFSLLFGVGLAIQHQRLAGHPHRGLLLLRRLSALLVFGLLHLYLIWNGDILAEYAVAAFVILPFLFASVEVLALACVGVLIFYILMPVLPIPISLPPRPWMEDHVVMARQVYGSGGFLETLQFRVREVPALMPLHMMILPRTLGLFLLGILCWKARLIQDASRHRTLLWCIGMVGVGTGLACTLASTARSISGWPANEPWTGLMSQASTILLAIGYASSVLALHVSGHLKLLVKLTAPIGRMAFSNYILQSVILGWIFYGYGLGLFGRIGLSAGLLTAVVIYCLQCALSAWWLRRFRFGPLEWIWRKIMYGHHAARAA